MFSSHFLVLNTFVKTYAGPELFLNFCWPCMFAGLASVCHTFAGLAFVCLTFAELAYVCHLLASLAYVCLTFADLAYVC